VQLYLLSLLQVIFSADIVGERNNKILLTRNSDWLVLRIAVVEMVDFGGQTVKFRDFNDYFVVAELSYIYPDVLLSRLN
jgi:hypothetical protein